jgi:EmrB/QacA subfamily drug resistance transporter
MILLDMSILNVAIPALLRDLGASINQVVWVTSAYVLAWAVPLLLSGRLGDRFGRKRIFLLGLGIFTLASLWCGLSHSPEMLITARAVQGVGAALITPQTLAFITYLFPRDRMGAAMGMWGAVAGLATITGPLAGGVLVEALGWQWIFFVNLPFGVLGFVATIILVPDWKPGTRHSFDPLGIALSGIGLFCLIFGVQNGQQYHWGTVYGFLTITEFLVTGGILMIAFVVWQRYNRQEPLVPLDLFRIRDFTLGNLANLSIGIGLTGAMLPLMIYLQNVLGLTALQAGLIMAPSSLISGVLAPFAGKLSDRIGGKYVASFGFAMLAIGIGIVAVQAKADTNPLLLLPGLVVMGVGIGCVFSPLGSVSMRSIPPVRVGSGSGIFNTSRQLGSVLGSSLVGVLLQAQVADALHAAAIEQAKTLAPNLRGEFIAGLDAAATHGAEGGGGAPTGLPARVQELAVTAFHQGFTSAATTTLWLPVGALFLGALVCLALGAHTAPANQPPPRQQEHAAA